MSDALDLANALEPLRIPVQRYDGLDGTEIVFLAGTSISAAAEHSVLYARQKGKHVGFNFNGVRFKVSPDTKPKDIEFMYTNAHGELEF